MSELAPPHDVYFKKRLDYYVHGESFSFDVGHTLFSSFQIDEGTDVFLRTIDLDAPRKILDIGCGVGVIGIVLARLLPEARILCTDRDLLAVRYTRHNARLNSIENLSAMGSVGFEEIADRDYDLITSNIPAKVGEEAIEQEFIVEPLAHLRPGGDYWFVVVSGLNHLIPKIGVRHQLRMKQVRKRAGHAVYHIKKPAAS